MEKEKPKLPDVVICYLFLEDEKLIETPEYNNLQKIFEAQLITLYTFDSKNEKQIKEEFQINVRLPRVYVSVGSSWQKFKTLCDLPHHEKKRWLHYAALNCIHPHYIYNCWLKAIDTLSVSTELPPTKFSSDTPLISIFTTTFRSGKRLQRPFRSLMQQTYTNWEWVIVDDSNDNGETWEKEILPLKDPRIRKYRPDEPSGRIGYVKRAAAGLCTGEILLEVDHDDDLMPNCLEEIVKTFIKYPECGFVYGDSAELYEESLNCHWYGWFAGFGFLTNWFQITPSHGPQIGQRTPNLNLRTIQHLVGLPNHPRAWAAKVYHAIGGHPDEMTVSDDYYLLVKTFLCTRFAGIPKMLYLQYRNANSNNQTFIRLNQIQQLCQSIERYYHDRIAKRGQELGLPIINGPDKEIWKLPNDDKRHAFTNILNYDQDKVSTIIPILTSESKLSTEQQEKWDIFLEDCNKNNWENIELILVGSYPAELVSNMRIVQFEKVRFWNKFDLKSTTKDECVAYGKFIRSGCKYSVLFI